jgi:uncharacterized protein
MEHKQHGKLSVSGEGRVQVRPDVANVNLGVVTEAKTAVAALADNAERMKKVIAHVEKLGIVGEDRQTVGLTIAPIIDWDDKSPTRGQVVGYRVEDTLAVRAEVKLAGRVLDEGIGAGATVAGNLWFGLRDESMYRDRALQAAIASAQHQANVIAHAAGFTLRGMVSVDVSWGGTPVVVRGAVDRKMLASTPIEPGIITIATAARVEFEY